MDWISWDDSLITGHAGIDSDHKETAQLFNRLCDAAGRGKGKAACVRLLDDIIAHAKDHFEQEQQLMELHRYPRMEQHVAEHAMLIKQALDYRQNFDVVSAESRSDLARFAEVWLAFHILFSDKDLAAFLARALSEHGEH